jgi:hypothetical protein
MQVIHDYKDNHMAPAGCELIDMQVMKYYKMIITYITYITSHLVAIPYHKTLPTKTS